MNGLRTEKLADLITREETTNANKNIKSDPKEENEGK